MTLPEIRERMIQLAALHNLPELRTLAEHTRRRRNCQPAPIVSAPVTDETRQAVREFAAANPEMTMHNIATHFDLNQGRVSEILYGKRA